MRSAPAVDLDGFSEAERSALRLDGDCFALGLSTVPVDLPVDAALRAASLAPAVARHDLVADTWAAAWVHGVVAVLPRPLTLAVDVRAGRRTRAVHPAPREARYSPGDVERRGGVLVTAPLRTALDLVRFEPRWTQQARTAVLRLAGLRGGSVADVRARSAALRLINGGDRVAERLRTLPETPEAQPAETRYTS